jgi:hypothetical protein
MRPLNFFVVLAMGAAIAWVSGWNPFLPKDYEECIESAAKSAKSQEALGILVSSCSSKFVGRRNVRGGGYTYHDDRQNSTFIIAGPNPTPEEWAYIEKQYAQYADASAKAEEAQRDALAKAEEAKRLQDAELQREQQEAQQRKQQEAQREQQEAQREQQEAQRQAQIAQANLERRTQVALSEMTVPSVRIECAIPGATICPMYTLTAEIGNQSSETISMLSIGWAFIGAEETCPTSVQTKRDEKVLLRPNNSVVLNIEGNDGPNSMSFRTCVMVNNAEIAP